MILRRQLLFLSLRFRVLSSSSTIQYIVGPILLVLHDLHFSLQSRVEMILYMIVGPAPQEFSDLRPTIAQLLVSLDNEHIFLLSPLVFLDVGIEVIVPSVSI